MTSTFDSGRMKPSFVTSPLLSLSSMPPPPQDGLMLQYSVATLPYLRKHLSRRFLALPNPLKILQHASDTKITNNNDKQQRMCIGQSMPQSQGQPACPGSSPPIGLPSGSCDVPCLVQSECPGHSCSRCLCTPPPSNPLLVTRAAPPSRYTAHVNPASSPHDNVITFFDKK